MLEAPFWADNGGAGAEGDLTEGDLAASAPSAVAPAPPAVAPADVKVRPLRGHMLVVVCSWTSLSRSLTRSSNDGRTCVPSGVQDKGMCVGGC